MRRPEANPSLGFTRQWILPAVSLVLISGILIAVLVVRNRGDAASSLDRAGTDADALSSAVGQGDAEAGLQAVAGDDPIFDEADPSQARKIPVPGKAATNSPVAGKPGKSQAGGGGNVPGVARKKSAADKASKPPKKTASQTSIEAIKARLALAERRKWGPAAEKEIMSLVAAWGNMDAEAALDYAMTFESRKTRTALMQTIFRAWMKNDPAGARMWFDTMARTDPAQVSSVVGLLYRDYAAAGLGVAADRVWALPSNSLKRGALSAVVAAMVSRDAVDELMDLHASMGPGIDRDLLVEAMVKGIAIYQPYMMADWAVALEDVMPRRQALDRVVQTWVGDQPLAAASWVEQIEDPVERSRQVAKVAQLWAREDAVATGDWLLSMRPPAESLDPAIVNFVKAVMKVNPSGAMGWAGAVSDEQKRNALFIQVGKQWLLSDPGNAAAGLGSMELPASVRDTLLGD